jgi:hypothetical protein
VCKHQSYQEFKRIYQTPLAVGITQAEERFRPVPGQHQAVGKHMASRQPSRSSGPRYIGTQNPLVMKFYHGQDFPLAKGTCHGDMIDMMVVAYFTAHVIHVAKIVTATLIGEWTKSEHEQFWCVMSCHVLHRFCH